MAEQAFDQARVLIVEDNKTSANIVGYLLQSIGVDAEFAFSGEEAVIAAANQNEPFDLILMDLHMPGINGMEATRQIHQQCPNGDQAVVVALTAHACEKMRRDCEEVGMADFLVKPATAQDLMTLLAEHLGSGTSNGEIDHEALSQMKTVMSDSDLHKLVSVCLEDIANRVRFICEAERGGNLDAIANHSHDIKSTSGQIGARGVLTLATEINCLCKTALVDPGCCERDRLARLVLNLKSEFAAVNQNLVSAYLSESTSLSDH